MMYQANTTTPQQGNSTKTVRCLWPARGQQNLEFRMRATVVQGTGKVVNYHPNKLLSNEAMVEGLTEGARSGRLATNL